MYSVYGLCDPETFDVYYIGCSLDPQRRYANHLNSNGKDSNKARRAWISMLKSQGLQPVLVIIEDNLKEFDADGRDVFTREAYWIAFYHDLGAPLTNVYRPNPNKRRQRMSATYYVPNERMYEHHKALGRTVILVEY